MSRLTGVGIAIDSLRSNKLRTFLTLLGNIVGTMSVIAVVSRGMGVSVVPAPLQGSGIAGAVFRPLDAPGQASEVFCAWQRGVDQPARDHFVEIVRRYGQEVERRSGRSQAAGATFFQAS